MADNLTWSALDHYNKGLGRHAGVWVQHAKPVTTGRPNSAWVMNWPDWSVLVGTGKSSHLPPCQRCTRRKVPVPPRYVPWIRTASKGLAESAKSSN